MKGKWKRNLITTWFQGSGLMSCTMLLGFRGSYSWHHSSLLSMWKYVCVCVSVIFPLKDLACKDCRRRQPVTGCYYTCQQTSASAPRGNDNLFSILCLLTFAQIYRWFEMLVRAQSWSVRLKSTKENVTRPSIHQRSAEEHPAIWVHPQSRCGWRV